MTSRPAEGPARLEAQAPPDWGTSELADRDALAQAFERRTRFTLGAEEELMILDPSTHALAPLVDVALERLRGDRRFERELRKSQVEIVSPVTGNAQALGVALAQARIDLAEALAPDAVLAAAGTHPWSDDWGDLASSRYLQLAEAYPWATAGSIPCGLHVHVAVPGAQRAIAIHDALRSFVPEITALAANSPFLEAADTGLSCARRMLSDAFHRSGIPPAFGTWERFVDFVRWGQTGGAFPDTGHLWWDVRPHVRHGTIELRMADAQTRVEDAVAVAGVVQSLVVHLAERLDAGERLEVHGAERISENLYRAVRYGVNGWMLDLETGARETTRDRISRLLDAVRAPAERLGNLGALHYAAALLADNGSDRQRYVAERAGDEQPGAALTTWLAAETIGSAHDLLARRV